MKRLICLVTMLSLAIVATSPAVGMEKVVNGNFTATQGDNEAGPPWVMNEDPFDGYNSDPNNQIDVGRFQKSGFTNREGNVPPNNGGVWFRSFNGDNGDNPGIFVDMTVTQTIAGLVNGNTYDLAVSVKQEQFHTSDSITATLGGDLNFDLKAGVTADGSWHDLTTSFTYTGGSSDLVLTFLNGSDAGANPQSFMLDNVSITPEPTSFVLAGMGIVGLIARRRRR